MWTTYGAVSPAILDLVHRDARMLYVGKQAGSVVHVSFVCSLSTFETVSARATKAA